MKKIQTSRGIMHISIPENARSGSNGEFYMVCPICSTGRKPQHQGEKKFAVNLSKYPMPWRCNHCGEAGYVLDENYVQNLTIKPILTTTVWNELSEPILKFFTDRKISKETLEHFKIRESIEPIYQKRNSDSDKIGKMLNTKAINFPYFKNDMLINVKYRDIRKNFAMIKGATKIFYNIDSIKDSKFAVIVEGEIDVLSYFEAGIDAVVSVPNGAQISESEKTEYSKKPDSAIFKEVHLEYLDLCINDFDHLETIYIATDNDLPGIKLREQLARRLGKTRCQYIDFGKYTDDNGEPCKDANDVLMKCGALTLQRTIHEAVPYPIDDVFRANQFIEEIVRDFIEGRAKGVSTGWKSLDPHFNWVPGWTYLVNGYPSQGKSSTMFNLILMSTILYKWKWGVYLPENYPIKNVVNTMVEILVGNTADPKFQGRMDLGTYRRYIENHIDKYIYFTENEKGFSPEQLREKKAELVKRYGINGFFVDPWLALNHTMRPKFGSIDEYINYELNFEIRLAQSLKIINVFAHHPSTPIKTKDKEYEAPSPFEPVGGQIWYNKIYGMICIHRHSNEEFKNTMTEFHIQKQKEEKLAGIRTHKDSPVLLRFDRRTNRLYEKTNPDDEYDTYELCPFDKNKLTFDEEIDMDF